MDQTSISAIIDIGEISADGILIYNLGDRRIEYSNHALPEILGITNIETSELNMGHLQSAIRYEVHQLKDRFELLLQNYSLLNVELPLATKPDAFISIDVYLLREQPTVIVFVKDITKSKQHTDYIVEYGARKNVILEMVANKLSGPLNLTYTLLDRVDQVTHSQQLRQLSMPVRIIRENTQQCISLIHSLVEEEHNASPEIYVTSNRFEVINKIQIIVERFRQFTPDKHITINAPHYQLSIWGDDVKFFQVVNNLISNAVKFTPSNGNIIVAVKDSKNTFTVTVRDDGVGIPEYLQPYIFESNSKASRAGLKGEKSIGRGLHIVKKLVTLMKGKIEFESQENRGSTFKIELPKDYRSNEIR
jgi:two-component system sensor histidine kinase VicK